MSIFSLFPTLHARLRSTDASEVAETALVLPLAFMMLLGIFWFGQAFSIYGAITQAAREGVRAATAPNCTTCAAGNTPSQNAFNAVSDVLHAANLDPSKLQQPTTVPSLCSCGSANSSCSGGSTVACDSSQSKICVQGYSGGVQQNVQLSYPANGGAGVCGLSVSLQYPFRFWLPFTSLNKQLLFLRADAQMRAENQ
jgi:uncharacterized iron-regulated membrane protein